MQVEESFYTAFHQRDLVLMRQVWEQSDDVICIHPGSLRIYSFKLIIASWKQIFSAPQATSIEITEPVYKVEENIAIHYVRENLSIRGRPLGSVYATNIYRQSTTGWKMIAHHASPAFADSEKNLNPRLH